jgi:protein SCO1/2
LKAGLVFIVTGAGIVFYFREERARLERKRIAEQTKGIGRPKVGGPFDLVDHNGKPFTDKDLKGKYSLVRYCALVKVDAGMRQEGNNMVY